MAYRIRKQLSDICTAHRLPGHPGGCKYLHGHNYSIFITLEADELNEQGFVIDFKDVKKFQEVVNRWDHATVLWEKDIFLRLIENGEFLGSPEEHAAIQDIMTKIIPVPFIPTVENMSKHLFEIATAFFREFEGVRVVSLEMYETKTSSCEYTHTLLVESEEEK